MFVWTITLHASEPNNILLKNSTQESPAQTETFACDDTRTYTCAKSEQQDTSKSPSWIERFSNMLSNTQSWWIQIALALLLGLFLSLTPCIYPMIPITVGILQAHGSTSIWRNLSLATAYTCGIATTFALLGLFSAFTGQLFGSLMSSPFIIIGIVALLAYLAGAMIGWYPMYTPKLFQTAPGEKRGGSLLAAFSFGAASGTVASPCLSPGLILLLSIVTKMGSIFLGFFLLFAFGIGLSIPLLIIGTFSGSLHVLPRAGMWMIEIKKLFGFMMFFMCLYFLQALLPWFVVLWLATLLCVAIGFYYLKHAKHTFGSWFFFYIGVGISLLAAALWCGTNAYQATYQKNTIDTLWLCDFEHAREKALIENKKILLDFSTPCCSICKAIDKKFFSNDAVQKALCAYIPVKINAADTTHKTHMQLQKQYHIIGVPTLILIDPVTGKEIMRWGSELYNYTVDEFVKKLKSLI